MPFQILVLNPGSTSTKAAVYEDEHPLLSKSIVHTNRDLAPYPALNDQLDYRVALVRGWLAQEGFRLSGLDAVVGRGGIIPISWPAAIWPMTPWWTACATIRSLTTPPTWAA